MCLCQNAYLFPALVREMFLRSLKARWIWHSKWWLIGQFVCISALLWHVLCGCWCKFFHWEHFEIIHNKVPHRHRHYFCFLWGNWKDRQQGQIRLLVRGKYNRRSDRNLTVRSLAVGCALLWMEGDTGVDFDSCSILLPLKKSHVQSQCWGRLSTPGESAILIPFRMTQTPVATPFSSHCYSSSNTLNLG